MELKLYRCAHCGNVAFKLVDKGVPLFCCGQKMDELVPNTTDGALEKHVPAVSRDGKEVSVQVGSVIHPMLEEHYIQIIAAAAGDTVTFDADLPHHFENPGPDEASFLAVVSAGLRRS